jgi:HD-GYP domain-containing protein (c-di-GMP phosphodiesterase class II)
MANLGRWFGALTPTRRFSIVLMVVLLVGGTSLSATAAWLIQRAVLGQTWLETLHAVEAHFPTIFGSDVFVQPEPTPAAADHDHGSGADYPSTAGARPASTFDAARFDRVVRAHLQVYDTVHARFYKTNGRIVYSYRPEEIGHTITEFAPAAETGRPLHGESVAETPSHFLISLPDGQTRPEVAAFYLPVYREGQIVGAAWVQRDVTELMSAIRQAQLVLVGITFGVVLLLFFALHRVYGDSTRTIRSQSTALEHAYDELSSTYDATLRALTAALDSRDHETNGHALRVTRLAVRLGQELGLTGAALNTLELGAVLHDIGKIGVPDAILLKPGPLTDAEWAVMRRHPVLGVEMLERVPFLHGALPLVRHHHERWDGKGYPDGLAGPAIPLGARIFAVADSFDAMTSRRPYRQPVSLRQARAELARCAGAQFDPAVVAASERIADGDLLELMETPLLGDEQPREVVAA